MYYFSRKSNPQANEVSPYLLIGCENGEVVEYNLKAPDSSKSKFFINQSIENLYFSVEQKKLFLLTNDQMFIKTDYDILNKSIDKVENSTFTPGFCQEILDIKIIRDFQNQSDDFKFLFASNDNNLKYFDTVTGQIQIYEGHTDFIMSIDVKQNYIATASKDCTVRLWQFEVEENGNFNCQCIRVFKGHSESLNSVALMIKHGLYIISGGKDKSLKVWDFSSVLNNSEEQVVEIKESFRSEIGHDEEIIVIRTAPNEKLFASGSYDKSIKVKYFIVI